MRFGLQLYGFNAEFRKDKEFYYKQFADMGIRYLEPCLSLAEEEPDPHAWTVQELKDNREQMQSYGLGIHSINAWTQDLERDASSYAEIAETYGISQVVISCPVFESEEQYKAAADRLVQAAVCLKEKNVELLIHNNRGTGKQYEHMLQLCGGAVGAQPDLGWLIYDGVDPETFLWKNASYIGSLHYKDMSGENGKERVVGAGALDVDACFQFARAQEIIQIIDQDGPVEEAFITEIGQAMNALTRCCWSHGKSRSILCMLDTETGELKQLHHFDKVVEAPNWHQQNPDLLYFNSEGSIWKYSISQDTLEEIHMSCKDCNNDHVLSPDGTQIAVSAENPSQIFIAPIEGGEARQITSMGPSYLHGWSVNQELCYCAFRTPDGKEIANYSEPRAVDVFRISTEGGEETRLTDQVGYNDGCEYSPDGEYIWYCSTRAGYMQVFRMRRDGSEVTQMTFTEENNWFGHISPDGSKVAYLTFSKEGLDPDEHLPNLNVKLGVMNADGSNAHTVLKFFGGQGSSNVNSWSPDNRHVALVVYELIHK